MKEGKGWDASREPPRGSDARSTLWPPPASLQKGPGMEDPGELGKGIGGVFTLEGLQVESSLHWEERVASSRILCLVGVRFPTTRVVLHRDN